MKPMLADEIDPRRLPAFAADDAWWFQQKVDGYRCLIVCDEKGLRAYNRDGAPKTGGLSLAPFRALSQLAGGVAVDAEVVGGRFALFDIPRAGAFADELAPYSERYHVLEQLYRLAFADTPTVALLPVARTAEQKHRLALDCLRAGAEGVMVKRHAAAYAPGERSPANMKAKFVKDADLVVTRLGVDGKDNVELAAYTAAGEMATPRWTASRIGKHPGIRPGSVVTLRYLYATDDGRIYQPRIVSGPRDDKRPEECLIDQLQFTDRSLIDVLT